MTRLIKAVATTPDAHCANCGTGVFDMVTLDKLHLMAGSSVLDPRFTLCQLCERLEAALIKDSGSRDHPLRLAHYERMEELHG